MVDTEPHDAIAQGRTNPPYGRRGRLINAEVFWRDNYEWLLEQGYKLRSRYQPSWTPSWEGTTKEYFECEDGLQVHHGNVVDAQRTSDQELLFLKRVDSDIHPHEAEIGRFFSTGDLASDPRNHCVPIYQVLSVPGSANTIILVMPMLKEHDRPGFDTIGEAVEFFHQLFEGLNFMHQNNVAHRDATYYNILMDARSLYIDRYHPFRPTRKLDMSAGSPKHLTRTLRPVKYYFADFGLSCKYRSEDRPAQEDVIFGGDKTVPEFKTSISCDPFATDVYTVGNLIKEGYTEGSQFAQRKLGFDFMKPLVADMTNPDPSKRPTMDEVVARFEKIRKGLSSWKLRSRVVKANEIYVVGLVRSIGHLARRVVYVATGVPAIPTPS
ncbi:hypothetical protein ONZ45_g8610 [Pleurotus djamor]|nr:hypothetical protein ONZ45_g8610 [Pleurotus djamor]